MGLEEYEIQELTKTAYNLLDSGETAKAIEYFENAARRAREAGNPAAIVTTYLNTGACLVTQGEHQRARPFLQSALKLLKSSADGHSPDIRGFPELKKVTVMRLAADVYHYLGVAYHKLNDVDNAIDYLTTGTKLYLREGLPKLAAESLTCMSHCYRDHGNTEKEIQTLKKLSQVYHELGDSSSEAETCMCMAKGFLKERKFNFVKQLLSTSRMLCQRVDSNDGSKLYCELGLLYSSVGSFDFAMDCFERALTMTRRLPRTTRSLQLEASILQNIGAVYNERNMFSEAVAYHQEAIAIHGKLANHNSESKCLCNLATAQIQLGQFEEAAVTFSNALAAAIKSTNIYLQLQACEGLGSIHLRWKKNGDAVGYFQEALGLLDHINEDSGIARERILEKLSRALEMLEENRGGKVLEKETSGIDDVSLESDSNEESHAQRREEVGSARKKVTRSLSPEFAAVAQTSSGVRELKDMPPTPKMPRKNVSLQERRGVREKLPPIKTGFQGNQPSPVSLPLSSHKGSAGHDKKIGKMKKQPRREESDSDSFKEDLQTYMQSYAHSSSDEDKTVSPASKPGTSTGGSVGEGSLAIGPRANFKVSQVKGEHRTGKKKGQRPKSKIMSILETEDESSTKESEHQTDNRTQQSKMCIIL